MEDMTGKARGKAEWQGHSASKLIFPRLVGGHS